MRKFEFLYHKSWLIILFIVISQVSFGQGNRKIVRQHNADIFKYNKSNDGGVFELRGNVILEHNGWFIYCDLAFLNKEENKFDAFDNVRIERADSVTITGDTLYYIGNKDIAKMRNNVVVSNDSLTLTTNILDYNTKTDIGYYYVHGKIVNEDNVLESTNGVFKQDEDQYIFFDDVILYDTEYVMYTDSIVHYSEGELSYFWGKTEIFGEDKEMYCKKGWYDSKAGKGEAEIDVIMKNEGKELKAEYVYFNDSIGYNKALRNVELRDTAQDLKVNSHFLEYFTDPEKIVITDEALITQYGEEDTLYLHADTLLIKTFEYTDSIKLAYIEKGLVDSVEIWEDTLYREFYAYKGVRFYRSDIQGKCDSMFVSTIDTTIHLYDKPVIWSGVNQMSADEIALYTENQQARKVDFLNSAFIIEENSPLKFNQVKGKNIYAYIKDSQLDYVEVRTNGESLYYVKEDEKYTSIYNTLSANIDIYFDGEGQIEKIIFIMQPQTLLTPLDQIKDDQKLLKNFDWQDEIRPKDGKDVIKKNRSK